MDVHNVQFGEGGAGTFSDGKLTTRSGDFRVDYVLQTFVEYGADPEILYLKKPHVGTDRIRAVVKRMRQEIIRLGGEFYFEACLTDINIKQGIVREHNHKRGRGTTLFGFGSGHGQQRP